ncbi:MAG: hypothetical protein A3F74_24510 [Betaproteobacteria bacterium RIFCSPLOWO2_12_FULL_62_58]|nr:MAG: hypothetical protein A3F74_24510 [Betaproteobacteria bacterium RIFCSPLOWO2_12_FULL_62_58]
MANLLAFFRLTIAPAALLACTGAVLAQGEFPSKPIRFLVGAAPGGATDILARALAPKLTDGLRQPVVVENRTGANQIIAAELTAKSPPDGYTILMVPSGFTINPAIYRKLPFDPVRDFSPLSLVANVPNVLVVHPSLPVKSVKEFIALVRKRPGEMSYGSSGVGSPSHLAGELFKVVANVQFTHVPYRGNGLMVIDLIGGYLQLSLPSIPASISFIRTGRLVPLGVTTRQRASARPDVPTIDEAGLKGYEVSGWYGVLAPGKVPGPIVTRLNTEINRVLNVPEMREMLSRGGAEPLGSTPQEFATAITTDLAKWVKVVAAAGIKAEQ